MHLSEADDLCVHAELVTPRDQPGTKWSTRTHITVRDNRGCEAADSPADDASAKNGLSPQRSVGSPHDSRNVPSRNALDGSARSVGQGKPFAGPRNGSQNDLGS